MRRRHSDSSYERGGEIAASLHGDSSAHDLLVLVPGMLYETTNPPEYCILRSVREEIGARAMSLMVERTWRENNDIYEIPPIQQISRIETIVTRTLEEYPNIRHVSYIAHSAGALVARYLVDNDSRGLLLAPPSQRRPVAEQIESCLDKLMPKDEKRSDEEASVYQARDGSSFVINRDVWSEIRALDSGPCQQKDINYVVASKDRAFPYAFRDMMEDYAKTTLTVDDSHSLRHSRTLEKISNYITKSMLH